jgi:serine/threonine-protein kinase HipA
MSFKKISSVRVYFKRGPEKLILGKLILKDRHILFEYGQNFIETGLEISPFKLPLKPGVITSQDPVFQGLFGVFNDSLPDGWGRLLLDRKLRNLSINPHDLSALDRLCYVGNTGLGALTYEPAIEDSTSLSHEDLDIISDACLEFQETDQSSYIDDLIVMNGSSSGARPKILLKTNSSSLTPNWIVKFRSSYDPIDIGPIEFAYHLMAKASGLIVPEAQLFKSRHEFGYFGVTRFDVINDEFHHLHSLSGLIHADHHIPNLDYETIMKVTASLTKNMEESEKLFRLCVFNVLSHNRDDHSKNFSFLMDQTGSWKLSPAYDLTFSSGPSGEHCTTVSGEGKNITVSHLLNIAQIGGIPETTAIKMIDDTLSVVMKWSEFAKDAGVTKKSIYEIESSLMKVAKNLKFQK